MTGSWDARSFRTWLIDHLSSTQFVTDANDDNLAKMSVSLGVQPDVLNEARLAALMRRVSNERSPVLGRKKKGTSHYQLELLMPEVIFSAWKQEAARRGIDGSALMRSLVHAYLLDSWDPQNVTKRWFWRGAGYRVNPAHWKQAHGTRYPFRERALIPEGAKRALSRRCQALACTVAALVRCLVIKTIDGEWGTPGTIQIVDSTTMFDDETRYCIP